MFILLVAYEQDLLIIYQVKHSLKTPQINSVTFDSSGGERAENFRLQTVMKDVGDAMPSCDA